MYIPDVFRKMVVIYDIHIQLRHNIYNTNNNKKSQLLIFCCPREFIGKIIEIIHSSVLFYFDFMTISVKYSVKAHSKV